MTNKISQPTLPPAQPEIYAPGYDSAFTHRLHVRRTAQNEARWFLPYLQPGMALLDCGCATGSITVGLAAAVAPGLCAWQQGHPRGALCGRLAGDHQPLAQ